MTTFGPKSRQWLLLVLTVFAALLWSSASMARAADSPSSPAVYVARLSGEVDPVTARYLGDALAEASRQHAAALVITIDTPGGLDSSMRQVVQNLLASDVPTIAYVSPSGARDASAGVFITEAANIVAMAPGTNIGAAHPVDGNGANIPSDMRDKITNDAAAYISGIAKQRGRNSDWVQDAVRKSVSLDAEQAVQQHVADLESPSLSALLATVDGRTVTTLSGPTALHTRSAVIHDVPMSPLEQLLQSIADPNIAYALYTIGFLALMIELFHPGALVPGVTGAVCLILSLVAFATLPLNWGGAALILLAVVLFAVDVKAVTHGALTAAGLICFIVGSLLLYHPPGPRSPSLPDLSVSPVLLVGASVLIAALSTLVVTAAVRIARRAPVTGVQMLVGAEGVTAGALTPKGVVRVGGQMWSAELHGVETLEAGLPVRVLGRDGLTLYVEPVAVNAESPTTSTR